jgi:hypothetical protein
MIRPPNDDDWLDEQFPLGDGVADTSIMITCPYCGEEAELIIDPGGNSVQQYIEDCEVCCRPWHLTVSWDSSGSAQVDVRTED